MEQAGIEEIIPKGIRTKDGRELEFDLIVFCTGFDMFHYRNGSIFIFFESIKGPRIDTLTPFK